MNPYDEGDFCCLITGEVVRQWGDCVAVLMPSRGGLSSGIPAHPWRMYIPKAVWEEYLKFCVTKGYLRGKGPFQDSARSLPISVGGTGRLLDMVYEGEVGSNDDHK